MRHHLGMGKLSAFFLLLAVFLPWDLLFCLCVLGVAGFVCIRGARRFLEVWCAS